MDTYVRILFALLYVCIFGWFIYIMTHSPYEVESRLGPDATRWQRFGEWLGWFGALGIPVTVVRTKREGK